MPPFLFRYEAHCLCDDRTRLECIKLRVLRATAKGLWVESNDGRYNPETRLHEKFVLVSGTKRYAYPTEEAALVSYEAKKRRQIAILDAQLNRARLCLQLARNLRASQQPQDYAVRTRTFNPPLQVSSVEPT